MRTAALGPEPTESPSSYRTSAASSSTDPGPATTTKKLRKPTEIPNAIMMYSDMLKAWMCSPPCPL